LQKRHNRAETGFPAIGVAQHEFSAALDVDHMNSSFLLPRYITAPIVHYIGSVHEL
jgi:hypothetical protein